MKLNLRRVDVQVSIFTACVVIICGFCIYSIGYKISYNDMIESLTERVYSIYEFLEDELDVSTFDNINTKDDMKQQSYLDMKDLFYDLKSSTGVQYIYTAKRNDADKLVYVIDGLSEDASDFRYPGDLIESEIGDDLQRALTGEMVLPKNIMHTNWGNIFITYLPIHDKKMNIVGAVGIEFEAEHQYKTYSMLRKIAPIIIIASCALSVLFAVLYFRRISNPSFRDLSNTDLLTALKSRNAYELDVENIHAVHSADNMGIIIFDLNGLKLINDAHGHEMGDFYIKSLANALTDASVGKEVAYRVGGDEFAVLIKNATMEVLDNFIARAAVAFDGYAKATFPNASFSAGKAICCGTTESDFDKAYSIADTDMYINKNAHYEEIDDKS